MKKYRPISSNPFKDFLPLKEYFVRNSRALYIGLTSLILMDVLQVLIPLVIKKAIDLLTLGSSSSLVLLEQGSIIIGISILIAFFRYIWRYLLVGHSRIIEEGLRNRLYEHLQTLSSSFYKATRTGDIMARAINDISSVRMATGLGLVALADGLVLGIAAMSFMVSINIKLTIISLIPTPIIIFFSKNLTRRMSIEFENVQKTYSRLTEQTREAFAGIRVIKAYNRESWEQERMKQEGEKYIASNMDLAKSLALFIPMMAIFANAGLAIVVWFGGSETILGDITTGDFVAFISYLGLLTWPMMAMGWVVNLMQRGAASMRRINYIVNKIPEIKDTENPLNPERMSGNIDIRGITLRYPGDRKEVLKEIELKISSGQTVAIVGRVGSGKSTLLNCIPRIIDVPTGEIFIDGFEIRHISLKILRTNIGFVPQEPFIFSDTIRNNVILGREGISQTKLEDVLQKAQLLEEIESLEDGLDTILGERGITLSGGQRQRLSIARALVTDPPILILDDALSMVDTNTEERILNRILKLRENRTTLIVSHRIHTIRRADFIAVLERGMIVEQGSHEKLLQIGGIYATLYERQILAQELELGVWDR